MKNGHLSADHAQPSQKCMVSPWRNGHESLFDFSYAEPSLLSYLPFVPLLPFVSSFFTFYYYTFA